jgi:hypothetical protein
MTFILFLLCLLYRDLCAGYHDHDIHSVSDLFIVS